MEELARKYKKFTEFEKFSYTIISRPNQKKDEIIKNFMTLNLNWKLKSVYVNEAKMLVDKSDYDREKRRTIKSYNRMYSVGDLPILSYALYSFYSHYRKGYFNTNRRIVDLYIIAKISLFIYLLHSLKFFVFKIYADPLMYEYYFPLEYSRAIKAKKMVRNKDYISELVEMNRKAFEERNNK